MPIYIIPHDQDPRRTSAPAMYRFRLDLEHFPELTQTLGARPVPFMWPSFSADVKKTGVINISHDVEKPGMKYDCCVRLYLLIETKIWLTETLSKLLVCNTSTATNLLSRKLR